ncbi:MAG: hypothetical protein ACYCVY_01160 [Acidiferrobacteraceae bacterium]
MVAEPFFGSLKKERIRKPIDKDRAVAVEDLGDSIAVFCHRTRRHSYLSGVRPDDSEARFRRQGKGLH